MNPEFSHLRDRILAVRVRLARGFQVFPFSIAFTVLKALLRRRELARRPNRVAVAQVAADTYPVCATLMWLDRVGDDSPTGPFDVCLRFMRRNDAEVADVFSALLTVPRLRSIGLYWDDERIADDLALMISPRRESMGPPSSTVRNQIVTVSRMQLQEALARRHSPLQPSIDARREARTLLKRRARGGFAVCLNLSPPPSTLGHLIAGAVPGATIFDLSPAASAAPGKENVVAAGGWALTLHERIALVQEADAYVGRLDALGCAALLAGRPSILVGGLDDDAASETIQGDAVMWLPSGHSSAAMAGALARLAKPQARTADA